MADWERYRSTKVKKQVHDQLVDFGFDLKLDTFYLHCRHGKCRRNQDGFYSKRLVQNYVKAVGLHKAGEPYLEEGTGFSSDIGTEKQREIVRKLKINNDRDELKRQKELGKLIERPALYLELAARTVVLDNGFRQQMEMEVVDLINLVDGNPTKQVEFLNALYATWDKLLDSYSTASEFEVLFSTDDEEL